MRGCYGPLTPSQLADLLASGNFVLVSGPYQFEADCSAACVAPSGSGSGGSGSGVDEGCPCDPLPLTLFLTASGSSTAWDGTVVALNYNPLTGDWVGSTVSPVTGDTITFVVECDPAFGYEYLLQITQAVGPPPGPIPAVALFIASCDPLNLSATLNYVFETVPITFTVTD